MQCRKELKLLKLNIRIRNEILEQWEQAKQSYSLLNKTTCTFSIAIEIFFPMLNMHFIPICPTQPSGAMILRKLPLFYIRKLSCKFQLILTRVPEADHPFATGNVMNKCTKQIATHVKFITKVKSEDVYIIPKKHIGGGDNMHT
jgi:hypothetical protein